MSDLAYLLACLDTAVCKAVRAGEIGTARSLRLHVGGPGDDLPERGQLLRLGDAIFACPRVREAQSGRATLCLWQGGQVATVSSAPAPRTTIVLTLLGSEGALHLCKQSP